MIGWFIIALLLWFAIWIWAVLREKKKEDEWREEVIKRLKALEKEANSENPH